MRTFSIEKSMSAKSFNDSVRSSTSKLTLLLVLLNAADTFFTSWALNLGAPEGNPIVASVIGSGMTWFLFYKLILVNSMIVFAGYFSQYYSIGRIGLRVSACAYSILIFYHMVSLSLLFMTGMPL